MFIRHWLDCDLVVTHGRLREWVIFTRREGDRPDKDTGAVMFNLDRYARAVLLDGAKTVSTVHEDRSESMYVIEGTGTLRAGSEEYALRDGVSFHLPAGMEHVLANTGENELELLTCLGPAQPGEQFQLHSWREDAETGQGHWYHIYRGPSAGRIHTGDIPPRKFPHPHNHPPGMDEIWYVVRGQGHHWVGRELHPQGPGWALWLEPEDLHSLVNPTDEWVQYLYCAARSAEIPAGEAPAERGAAEEATYLAEQFEALVAAYEATGVVIAGVSGTIPKIRASIEKIRI